MQKVTTKNGRRSEDELVEQLLERIRGLELLEDEPLFFYEEACLLRFLKARSWSVRDAEKQLRSTVEWRRKYRPLYSTCTFCIDHPGRHSIRQIGFDKVGRPILYANLWQAGGQKISSQEAVDHCVYLMENAIRTMTKDITDWIIIIDCTGMSAATCNPKMGYEVCEIFSRYYPERLYRGLCINHNPLFQWMWNAIKKLLPPETSVKVNLISKKKMDDAFKELFPEDVCNWLHREILLNTRGEPSQKLFWLPPNEAKEMAKELMTECSDKSPLKSSKKGKDKATIPEPSENKDDGIVHDARGVQSYVSTYIEPLLAQLANKKDPLDFVQGHQPHPNTYHRSKITHSSLEEGDIALYNTNEDHVLEDIEVPEFPDIPPELLTSVATTEESG